MKAPWAARLVTVTAVFAVLAGGLSACSSDSVDGVWVKPSASPSPSAPPLSLAITPAKAAVDLPISTEIGTAVVSGKVQSVALTDSAGKAVAGQMREDGSSWVPDQPLKAKQSYHAVVTAVGLTGQTVTQETDFTTMARPSKRLGSGLYLFADKVYGVAMPVVVEFTGDVPDAARATVQSRLFVTTDPPQPGVWHWTGPRQVTYRAPEYWKPGTTITVRAALDGVPLGDGRFGDTDRRGVGHISPDRIELFVDNATKQMQVVKNGETIRTMPVSLGKPERPSSSGVMVIMDKQTETVFDTTQEPGDVDHYRVEIKYAQRLTWKGEFIHAAPWSVKDQGVRNVSHGCVNVSMENAAWLYELTRLGDPVTVKGTERDLADGNGFTAWDLPWSEYIKGSALPVPPALAAAGASPTPSPSASGPSALPSPR